MDSTATVTNVRKKLPRLDGLAEPYLLFWRHRRVLLDAVKQMLRARFAGSLLGLAWLIVGPTILLVLYTLIYAVIFRVRPVGMTIENYIFYIFSGLVPFLAFSMALTSGSASLATDRALLLNRIFPAALIPARDVLAAGTTIVVGGGLILLAKLVMGEVSAWDERASLRRQLGLCDRCTVQLDARHQFRSAVARAALGDTPQFHVSVVSIRHDSGTSSQQAHDRIEPTALMECGLVAIWTSRIFFDRPSLHLSWSCDARKIRATETEPLIALQRQALGDLITARPKRS